VRLFRWIPIEEKRNQIGHASGQRKAVELILAEGKIGQTSQAGWQSDLGEEVLIEVKLRQCSQSFWHGEAGERIIAPDKKPRQICQAIRKRNVRSPIQAEVEKDQCGQARG